MSETKLFKMQVKKITKLMKFCGQADRTNGWKGKKKQQNQQRAIKIVNRHR